MAEKHRLRINRAGTVINRTSSKQEKELSAAINAVSLRLMEKFPGVRLHHEGNWQLSNIVARLLILDEDTLIYAYGDYAWHPPHIIGLRKETKEEIEKRRQVYKRKQGKRIVKEYLCEFETYQIKSLDNR